jgi:hypothetical protein
MAGNIRERQRKVELAALAPEQVEQIGFQLGKKAGEIADKAAEEINKITQIYGLKAKIAIQWIDAKTGKPVS